MRSLRSRLFVGLTLAVLVAGAAAGFAAFRWAFDEAIELQDAVLLQVGALAVRNTSLVRPPANGMIDAEALVTIEEIGANDDRGVLADGLQTLTRGGKQVRVLISTRGDGSRVAVSQSTDYRDEIAHDSALHTVLPLAALIPCLLLLAGAILGNGFRPVARLARQLAARTNDPLARLPLDGMPDELRPFVSSINRLLGEIAVLLDRQRRFVADAAHELRTPITALSLHAENLSHVPMPPEAIDRLVALNIGIRRTAHLLEQLLDLARYEDGDVVQTGATSLDSVVRSVIADLIPVAAHREVDLGVRRLDAATVSATPTALAALVRNLIENALRHSPAGQPVDVSLIRESGRAILQVEDRGPGIPPADLERVFEPFFRGDPTGEGTGLGLSIVRRIVERLAGTIALENNLAPGRTGLRVTVTLPL